MPSKPTPPSTPKSSSKPSPQPKPVPTKVRLDGTHPNHSGRQLQSGQPAAGEPGRGSSMQGEKQSAKGGPQGANQGGAPRGTSRLDPSHTRRNAEHYTGKKKPAK